MKLNERAWEASRPLWEQPDRYRVAVQRAEAGSQIIDCGVQVAGGLEAGRLLAETCLAGLGQVSIVPGDPGLAPGPSVCVATDHPVAACMGAQYAGWQITGEKFFAMGSGPMRALRGREKLLADIGLQEAGAQAVGILESRKLPPLAVCRQLAEECGVDPAQLRLLVAPTASLAGGVQVVARTVETALHKLHELGFDLNQVVSGFGVAPLPPVAADDLAAIGRTNDAVLYGGSVTLWVRCPDEQLADIGPRLPSSASRDFGRPFAEIFAEYGHDFYRIDPLLFSPALVHFVNLQSGRSFRFGRTVAAVLGDSWGTGTP